MQNGFQTLAMKVMMGCLSTVSTQFQRIKFNSFTNSVTQFITIKTCMEIITHKYHWGRFSLDSYSILEISMDSNLALNLYQSSWLSLLCTGISFHPPPTHTASMLIRKVLFIFLCLLYVLDFQYVWCSMLSVVVESLMGYKPKGC